MTIVQSLRQFFAQYSPQKASPPRRAGTFAQRTRRRLRSNISGGSAGQHLRLVQTRGLSDKCYMVLARQILRPALDFVLPERCPGCGVITPREDHFAAGAGSDCIFWSRPGVRLRSAICLMTRARRHAAPIALQYTRCMTASGQRWFMTISRGRSC